MLAPERWAATCSVLRPPTCLLSCWQLVDWQACLCYTRRHGRNEEGDLTRYDDRRGLGRRGEDLAEQRLTSLGFEIMARNWRCEYGELDLVAKDGECLAFVEVRARRGRSLGTPEESITSAKQARLIDLAEAYVQAHDWMGDWRIDVVAVEMDRRGRLLRMDHYENAVTG